MQKHTFKALIIILVQYCSIAFLVNGKNRQCLVLIFFETSRNAVPLIFGRSGMIFIRKSKD